MKRVSLKVMVLVLLSATFVLAATSVAMPKWIGDRIVDKIMEWATTSGSSGNSNASTQTDAGAAASHLLRAGENNWVQDNKETGVNSNPEGTTDWKSLPAPAAQPALGPSPAPALTPEHRDGDREPIRHGPYIIDNRVGVVNIC
jgi:hypothetical protein